MKEEFSDEEIQEIIQDNSDLVAKRGESFGVNREELDKIFDKINDFEEIIDQKTRIIKKTSWILGGITFFQPFCDGNKEIALSLAIYFLRQNRLDIPINSKVNKKEIFELLTKTVLKFEGDTTIISDVEKYLFRRIIEI